MKRLADPVVLVLVVLASAQTMTFRRESGRATISPQQLRTSGATTIGVDQGGSGDFTTIQGALDSYPIQLLYRQRLNLDAGTYDGGFGKVVNHVCGSGDGITWGGIDVYGAYQPAALAAGINAGTSETITGTTANSATWAHVDVADAGWTAHSMADGGYWFQAVAGAADVQEPLAIWDNGANSLELVGQWRTAPALDGGFVIREGTSNIYGHMAAANCPVSPGLDSSETASGSLTTSRKCQVAAFGNACGSTSSTQVDTFLTFHYVNFVSGDTGSTVQASALADDGSPIQFNNVRWTQWGTGTRGLIPLGRKLDATISRSHADFGGGRISTFNNASQSETFLHLDRSDIQNGSSISAVHLAEFFSVNNLYRGLTLIANDTQGFMAGDQILGTASMTFAGAHNGVTASHLGERWSAVGLDAITATAWGPALISYGEALIDHQANSFGPTGASTFTVPANTVAWDIGAGGMVRWKHGVTVWAMTATESTRSLKTNHNLGTGTKLSDLDSSVRGWIEGPYGVFAGWSDDTNDPTSGAHLPVYGSCEAGGVMDPNSHGQCSIRLFAGQATANGSGVATLTFGSPLCQIAPVCQCGDTNGTSIVQIPSSTTSTCVCTALTGAAGSGHVINITGFCNTIK